MKKMLLLSVMVLAGLSASAQFKSHPSVNPQTNSKVKMANMPQSQRSFQAVAPRQDLRMRSYAPGKKLNLDLTKVKPVTRTQRTSTALPTMQTKAFGKGKMQNRRRVNLQPTLTLNPQTSTKTKAARKAPAFAEKYTGTGDDYFEQESVQWDMTPSVATANTENGEEEVNVLLNVIPVPLFLSELFPDGIPVMYTIDDNDGITIEPQAIASYEDEENGTTNYVTIFSANSNGGDGIINMVVDQNGKLTVTNGNWIGFGEFADVEFDEEMGDSEAFLGFDELISYVNYYLHVETNTIEYYGHGVDYFENAPADWTMQRVTITMDDEESSYFINMVPMVDVFSELYPNGIDVAYEQNGNTITVKPQVIAHADTDEGTEYILLFSYSADDGNIVLTLGEDGSLTTVKGESIAIGAWETENFDPEYETWLGAYTIIDNVKYRLPDAPPAKPEDTSFEPEELVLFAGLGYSGYSYTDNLAVMGAYAPTTFRNTTMDIATSFDWSVVDYGDDDEETTITSQNRDFTINAKGGDIYENITLTAYNEKEASEPFIWGIGHCPNQEETGPRYETIHVYAGKGAAYFNYGDGSYATMTRQNPDGDLTFYTNWGTPDIYDRASISTIYSYQGKPATPLFITGVTLPMVSFEAQDDFNLHIKLCKCTRSATGRITLGDIIAEGDATVDNVNADYDVGITAVEFTDLYLEDEFGMSESVEYLFIEDEFLIVIEGWDNGTFSGVLGSQDIDVSQLPSTWFALTDDEEGTMRYYTTWRPQLFIGLLDASYGYLHTEDDTDIIFGKNGGTYTMHIDPMYYDLDEETEEPTYSLYTESIIENGEEVEELPEWISFEIANEDYTTATATDEDGEEYTYFVNGIDYDMVISVEELPEDVESRTVQIVFFQVGAKLTVTITQDTADTGDPVGISTVVEKTPIKNSRAFNMAGQPVSKNYKGIVVKDGKKVLVK